MPEDQMLRDVLQLESDIRHMREENARICQRSLAFIDYSEQCYQLIDQMVTGERPLLTSVYTMIKLQERGAELLPHLVKESTK